MQADEQKDLETNSLVESFSSLKSKIDGRSLYYFFGTICLIVAAVLFFRYLARQKTLARDEMLLRLESADTPEKLKEIMEQYRGSYVASNAKLHLARRELTSLGLEKIGTDNSKDFEDAVENLESARTKFSELVKEFKANDDAALLQECWLGIARAEETLVGVAGKSSGADRGDLDKSIEAYTKAAAIFPTSELSKAYAARAKELKENKAKFIEAQKAYYSKPTPPTPPITPDPKTSKTPVTPDPKVTPPAIPELKLPDPATPKKDSEPKKVEPENKKTEQPKK